MGGGMRSRVPTVYDIHKAFVSIKYFFSIGWYFLISTIIIEIKRNAFQGWRYKEGRLLYVITPSDMGAIYFSSLVLICVLSCYKQFD